MNRNICAIAFFSFITTVLGADAPLAPPEFESTISRDKSTQIDSDPTKESITAYAIANGQRGPILWEISEWSQWIDISADGQICILDLTGGLLPLDFKLNEPVLKIFESGKLIKILSIRDMLNDPLNLQRTTSHYSWKREIVYESNSFTIWTVDSRIVVGRNPIEIKKFKISEEEMRTHGIRKTFEISKIMNLFGFIGK